LAVHHFGTNAEMENIAKGSILKHKWAPPGPSSWIFASITPTTNYTVIKNMVKIAAITSGEEKTPQYDITGIDPKTIHLFLNMPITTTSSPTSIAFHVQYAHHFLWPESPVKADLPRNNKDLC
jgi:hypothetical protein